MTEHWIVRVPAPNPLSEYTVIQNLDAFLMLLVQHLCYLWNVFFCVTWKLYYVVKHIQYFFVGEAALGHGGPHLQMYVWSETNSAGFMKQE